MTTKTIFKVLATIATLALFYQTAYAAPTVLFDEGHKQVFLTENHGELDLSHFADILTSGGLIVKNTTTLLTKENLKGVDGLIISGPFAPLTPEEEDAVINFVENGGKLALMLHIPFPLDQLMFKLGVVYSNGVIKEQNNNIGDKTTDFAAETSGKHPLVRDVSQIGVYGAWAVSGTNATTKELAATSVHAWVDLNKDGTLSEGDAMQKLGVVVAGSLGKGEFVVFGDDAIFQNRFLHNQNEKLAHNFTVWITHTKENNNG